MKRFPDQMWLMLGAVMCLVTAVAMQYFKLCSDETIIGMLVTGATGAISAAAGISKQTPHDDQKETTRITTDPPKIETTTEPQ